MPKTNQSKQPEAAIKAKPRLNVAQSVPQRAAPSQPKTKLAPAIQSKPKAKPAPAVQAKPKAQSRVATQAKPKAPAPRKTLVKAAPVAVPAPTPSGKLGILVQMLKRPQGASVYDLADAVGWNTNSIRGAMAGSLKARGFIVTSEKPAGTRIYRIAPPPKTSVRGCRG